MMKLKQLLYGCFAILALLTAGCKDDWDLNGQQIIEGDAQLSITVAFNQENTEIGTRAPEGGDKGDIMDNINTLYLVIYNKDGKLHGKYPVRGEGLTPHKDVSDVHYELTDNRTEQEGEQGLQNDATGKVTFNLKLSSGNYYIYAVANVDDFDDKDVSTRDQLKALEFNWDEENTSNNSQMFGIFTFESNRNATDEEPLAISATTPQLHCWVRRLASKVTVAFDGSDLYDNVQIYITNIAIKDIPKICVLGNPNTPGPDNNDESEIDKRKKRYEAIHGVIETGKSIKIQELPTDITSIVPDNYLHICNNQHPYLGIDQDKGSIADAHGHQALSLFFYENMQGTGKDKAQSNDGNNIALPNPDMEKEGSGWKDEMAYGTYIEVEGFYRCSSNSSRLGYGPIKFRYMLGQKPRENRPDDNYDAKRNTHYKLTLKFKGYGNDADWHIDYKEDPGIYITSPQYISYLYNKSMMATVKIVGEIEPGTTLHAEIVGTSSETAAAKSGETFWRPWGNGTEEYPNPDDANDPVSGGDYYWKGTVHDDGPWNSFLSLKKTQLLVISDSIDDKAENAKNKKYFIDNRKGTRDYTIDQGSYEPDDLYRVEYTKSIENSIKERIFYIPLYTRAKVLFVRTGYTGNNPFVAYPRKAKIKFWANIKNPDTGNFEKKETYLEIIQVRRIVNPKGIWRDEQNAQNKPFHVRLLRLPGEENDFVSFDSQGGWCADVIQDGDNIISLSTTEEGSGINAKPQHGVTHIEGATEHPIDFTINFNGNKGCAIVRVRYHNYTCEHDIFCSVGNDPVKLTDHDLWWSTRNVYRFDGTKPILTETPIEEGSLFRRANYTAILASNNEQYGLGTEPGSLEVIENTSASITNQTWTALQPSGSNYNEWPIAGDEERIATIEDFFTLVPTNSNDMDFPIKQAYGVLYGDGAKEVAYKRANAYGNMREDGTTSSKGMQGCFVYNKNTCKHIFLPIGASGYGHRKHSGGWKNYDPAGALRYAGRSRRFDLTDKAAIIYQPLFYDLYRRPGAIYWCRNRNNEGTNPTGNRSSAFDINYFTMSFGGYGNDAATNNNGSDSHACFIRTVRYVAPK